MIVLNLKAKVCMSHLLLKPTFDTFSLIEGEVTTFNRFQVDGRIHKDFFDEAFEKEYSTWGEVRDFFFQVIRGKKTPLNFKFILSLAKDQFESFLTEHDLTYRPAEIQGLYLNFRYDGLALQCITGTSMNTFTMDKMRRKSLGRICPEILCQFRSLILIWNNIMMPGAQHHIIISERKILILQS